MNYNNVRGAKHSRRARLLATVGTAALATFLTGVAQAQYASVTVNANGEVTINGTGAASSLDNPAADIRASVIDTVQADVVDNVVVQTSQVVGNTITADAAANRLTTAINLVDQNLTPENGIASLVQMVNDGLARSLVDNNILIAATPGEIVATTVANKATTITSGVAPATNLGGAGSSYTTLQMPNIGGTDILRAEGGIISSILQTNHADYDDSDLNPDFARGNSAVADSNEISLDVLFSDEDANSVSLEVEKNKIAAGYTGNSATNQVALTNGAPTFEGSAIIVTGQDNQGVYFGDPYTGAFNTNNWIGSYVESGVFDVNGETFWVPFSGDLNVANNAITASATGNNTVGTDGAAGNSIQLDGVSFAGANEEEAHIEAYAYAFAHSYSHSMVDIRADLGIANRQRNDNTNLTAEVDGADIEGYADDLEEGSVNVSANTIAATATGSNGANAIRVEGAPLFAGTAAVANVQDFAYSAAIATIEYSDIYAGAGYEESLDFEVAESNVSATGNRQSAVATGNIIAQKIVIDATTIALGTPVWSERWLDYVEAVGSLVVSNLQVGTGSSASASVNDSSIIAEADEAAAIGSRIEADGNLQEARAIGNAATNSLLLNGGGTVGIGGSVTNIQFNWGSNSDANVNAVVEAGADYTSGGTTALTDNTQLAVAMSNNAANTLSVKGTTLDDVVRSPNFGDAVGFELSNDQYAMGGAIAEVLNHEGQEVFEAFADGDLYQSSLLNEHNTAAAVAVGNQVASSLDLEFVTIDAVDSDLGHVASLDNQQVSFGYIQARLGGAELIEADVDGLVDGSAISVSDNVLEASAYGNIADNALNVKGQKVITDGLVVPYYDQAAFVVQNYQDVWNDIDASQNYGGPTSIEIEVGSDILDSTLTLADNRSTTQLLGNLSANSLTITATDLRSSARLESDQQNRGYMSVSAGSDDVAPTPGTEDQPFTVSAKAELTGVFDGEGFDVTGGYFTVPLNGLSGDQISYMDANGWELFTNDDNVAALRIPAESWFPGLLSSDALAWWQSSAGVFAFDYSLPGLPGDLGSPNGGGVLVDLEGDLSGSTVHIADNTARANAIANSVSNSMTVSATRLEAESRFYLETVYDQNDLPVENAIVIDQTDFELDNDQDAGDDYFAYVQVEIFGSYGVTTYTDFAATDSKIEIKDNTQSVLALANAATNAVTLAATNIGGEESYGATSRLESDQDGDIEVDASSDLQLFAPLKGEGTSVAISGNTNAAYAGMNDVINTLKVGGTSISGGRFTTDAADVDGSDADHVLDNDQDSRGWIQSDATTTIVNNEIDMLIAEGTDFVVNLTGGSVAVNGNVTTAEVNANRAVNSVVLTGVASQTASAALRNRQDNDANVTATAATNATLSLNGGTGSEQSALVNGGIVLNGNVTEAIARGNNAINTMTVGTTGNNSVNATLAPLGGATASGPALMVNRQTNDNSVSATASATYRVILNADGVQAATGSTVAVTGNVVNAVAFGNRASNVLTLNAMPGGTTGGAVVSNQTNNGAITATASSVIFGVGIPSSGMQSAQTSVSGNQIAASAVGNAVTTTINIGR